MPGPVSQQNPGAAPERAQRIPWAALKRLSNRYGLTHLILFCHDGKSDHVVTYGRTTEQSGQAADFGNKLKGELGWPVETMAQSSRVRRLQERIKELEAQLEALKEGK